MQPMKPADFVPGVMGARSVENANIVARAHVLPQWALWAARDADGTLAIFENRPDWFDGWVGHGGEWLPTRGQVLVIPALNEDALTRSAIDDFSEDCGNGKLYLLSLAREDYDPPSNGVVSVEWSGRVRGITHLGGDVYVAEFDGACDDVLRLYAQREHQQRRTAFAVGLGILVAAVVVIAIGAQFVR